MDDRRFDRFVKRFTASSIGRRGILAAFVGAAVWSQARNADSAQPACVGDGSYCGLWQRCCPGAVCHVTATNPNSGTCRAGTDVNGTGMVMLGPTGQVLTAQAVATSTPRPTNVPKATRTPKPTSTPKSRTSLTPNGDWNLSATLSCNTMPEETRITNTGNSPLLLSRIASVRKGLQFDTAGSPEIEEIVIAPNNTLVFRSGFLEDGTLTDQREFYAKSKKEKARILVRKLDGDGSFLSESGGDMEFRAFCNGEPSVLVSETSALPTATPTATSTPTPTPSPTPSDSESGKRDKRRRKSRNDRKRRNENSEKRNNRD